MKDYKTDLGRWLYSNTQYKPRSLREAWIYEEDPVDNYDPDDIFKPYQADPDANAFRNDGCGSFHYDKDTRRKNRELIDAHKADLRKRRAAVYQKYEKAYNYIYNLDIDDFENALDYDNASVKYTTAYINMKPNSELGKAIKDLNMDTLVYIRLEDIIKNGFPPSMPDRIRKAFLSKYSKIIKKEAPNGIPVTNERYWMKSFFGDIKQLINSAQFNKRRIDMTDKDLD